MTSESKESPSNNPGLHSSPDEATKGYFMQQTVRNSQKSFFLIAVYHEIFLIVLVILLLVNRDIRCLELKTPKSAWTSTLAYWECRKSIFSDSTIMDSNMTTVITRFNDTFLEEINERL